MPAIIRQHETQRVPWKNGLGITSEIAVQTSIDHPEEFLWRVSIAEVSSAAPFSVFPGIDRHIVLLEGAGFRMTLDGTRRHALDTPFVPFAFAGESTVTVELVDGATRDFNLMVRRAEARGEIQVIDTPGARLVDAFTVLIHAARGAIETPDGLLHEGDTWLGNVSVARILLQDDAVALMVRIHPADTG